MRLAGHTDGKEAVSGTGLPAFLLAPCLPAGRPEETQAVSLPSAVFDITRKKMCNFALWKEEAPCSSYDVVRRVGRLALSSDSNGSNALCSGMPLSDCQYGTFTEGRLIS